MTVYEMINKIILEKLEEGVVPWQKMWRSDTGLPAMSLSTGKPYNGINQILLSCLASDFKSSPYFLTYNQAVSRGGFVKPGESGFPIYFFKKIDAPAEKGKKSNLIKDNDDKKEKSRFILRYYTVFNLQQCEDVELNVTEEKLLSSMEVSLNTFPPDLRAEGILKSYYEMPKVDLLDFQTAHFVAS